MHKYRQPAAGMMLAVILYLTLSGRLFDFIFIAVLGFLMLSGTIAVLRLLMESDVHEDDVRKALSTTVWKTMAEIETEIKADKGLSEEERLSPVIASFLQKMEARNVIEQRIRTWDPKRSTKNDEGEPEFRRKVRGNAPRKRPQVGIIRLAPQPT